MKIGVRVECVVCHRTKAPHGRSVPIAMAGRLCDSDCSGYYAHPRAGTLWPGETEKDFGYPVGPYGWEERN